MRRRLAALAAAAIAVGPLSALSPTAALAADAVCGAHAWCDPALDPDTRARMVLAELTLDEKLDLMGGDEQFGALVDGIPTGTLNGVPRLDVPDLLFTDGPVGVRDGQATQLPTAIALASTWSEEYAFTYGKVIGNEAFHKGRHVILGPNVNIARTPYGGRTFEAYGEDPHLTSRIAVGWIEGAQSEPVIADVKHYVANNQETDRFVTSAEVDDRTLREIYLPAFEASVKEADVGTVMLAYNRLNGEKVTQNKEVVRGILKDEWGFEGIALTDWYAAMSSTGPAVEAGTDLEMPYRWFYEPSLLRAELEAGRITEAMIDEAVHRILRTMFAFGIFDRPPLVADDAFDRDAHDDIAREIAAAGAVLLRNEGLLPVDESAIERIAIIGEAATQVPNGGGSSSVTPTNAVSPLDGITARAAQAGIEVVYDSGSDPEAAGAVAASADLAIVVAANASQEFADRPCLFLDCSPQGPDIVNPRVDDPSTRSGQDLLITRVAAAQPSTLVALYTGGPVLMPWAGEVGAILESWYAGQQAGTALAEIVFGDTEPTGRLPITFPVDDTQLPTFGDPRKYPGVGLRAEYLEGVFVGYRHYDHNDIEPLYPFGHGLGYTTFELGDVAVTRDATGALEATATVTNTGARRGTEVVQLYLGRPGTLAAPEPPRWLVGFERVELAPGASADVTLPISDRALSHWDVDASDWAVAPGCYSVWAGRSSRELTAPTVVQIGGAGDCAPAPTVVPEPPAVAAEDTEALPATGAGAAGLALLLAPAAAVSARRRRG